MFKVVMSKVDDAAGEFEVGDFIKKSFIVDAYDSIHGGYPISKIADTRCEKAVLQQICFWYPKAKTVRKGYFWAVKPADEFQKWGVDYEADTIRRAIRALVKKGVLITERHFHTYRFMCGPVLWIRPAIPIFDDTKGKPKKTVQAYVAD